MNKAEALRLAREQIEAMPQDHFETILMEARYTVFDCEQLREWFIGLIQQMEFEEKRKLEP